MRTCHKDLKLHRFDLQPAFCVDLQRLFVPPPRPLDCTLSDPLSSLLCGYDDAVQVPVGVGTSGPNVCRPELEGADLEIHTGTKLTS